MPRADRCLYASYVDVAVAEGGALIEVLAEVVASILKCSVGEAVKRVGRRAAAMSKPARL